MRSGVFCELRVRSAGLVERIRQMWQRIEWWILFLVLTLTMFACGVLYISGLSALKVFTLGAPVVFGCIVVRTISLIATSSNPRTKAAVDRLKNRLFK